MNETLKHTLIAKNDAHFYDKQLHHFGVKIAFIPE